VGSMCSKQEEGVVTDISRRTPKKRDYLGDDALKEYLVEVETQIKLLENKFLIYEDKLSEFKNQQVGDILSKA